MVVKTSISVGWVAEFQRVVAGVVLLSKAETVLSPVVRRMTMFLFSGSSVFALHLFTFLRAVDLPPFVHRPRYGGLPLHRPPINLDRLPWPRGNSSGQDLNRPPANSPQ